MKAQGKPKKKHAAKQWSQMVYESCHTNQVYQFGPFHFLIARSQQITEFSSRGILSTFQNFMYHFDV
jgi:hypothetical protein